MSYRTTTVLTPADSYDLVSLDDLKSDLGITDGASDAYLERAISRASAAVAQYCGRVFALETVQDVFDGGFGQHRDWGFSSRYRDRGHGVDALQASRFPIVTITSLMEGETALVEDTDYRVDTAAGIIARMGGCGGSWEAGGGWGGPTVTLIYSAGYAVDAIPLDLQGAVTSMVSAINFNRTRDPMLRSENILSGLYAYTLFDPSQVPAGTAEQVSSTLDAYRLPGIA